MSIPVSLERLRGAIEERGRHAYVLTVSDDGRPHAVHALMSWEGDFLVADIGQRTACNATARPSVSVLYPVRGDADYSLIVDGNAGVTATADGHRLLVTPTRAVLHRSAPAADPTTSRCGADCVPLFPSPGDSDI